MTLQRRRLAALCLIAACSLGNPGARAEAPGTHDDAQSGALAVAATQPAESEPGNWPAVRNFDNTGASHLLGGRLSSPTVRARYRQPNHYYPVVARMVATPPSAAPTAWGEKPRPATQDFDGDGNLETIRHINAADSVKVQVVSAPDGAVLWEHEISMENRPGLHLIDPIIADVVPELNGDEAIFFGNWIDVPRKEAMGIENEDGFFGYICCVSYADGVGRMVWENEQMHITYSPGVIIDDIDEDGIQDIVVSVHFRMFAINGQTGETTHDVFFSHGRNYALVQTFEGEGDVLKRVLISGDFYQETTVVEMYRDADGAVKGRAAWTMLFEDTVGLKNANSYSTMQMIQDLDGDGKQQILLNFFNKAGHRMDSVGGFDNPLGDIDGDGICDGVSVIGEEPYYLEGDGRWHALVLDPNTGRVQQEVPDQFFMGAADLNRSGRPELFMLATHGHTRPGYGRLSLWSDENGRLTERWSAPGARGRIVKTNPGHRPNFAANIVNGGIPIAADLDGDGAFDFLILSDQDGDWNAEHLECFTVSPDPDKLDVTSKWSFDIPAGALQVLAVEPLGQDPSGVTSLVLQDRRTGLRHTLDAATGQEAAEPVEQVEPGGAPWNPKVVAGDFDDDDRLELIACESTYETVVLEYRPGDPEPFAEQARFPGHGLMAENPLVSDLDDDGRDEVIVARPNEKGEMEIAAYTIDGELLWSTPAAEITFSRTGDRSPGGLTGTPVAADFTGDGVKDVYFSAFREGMGHLEGFAFSGADGSALWHARGIPGHDTYTMIGSRNLAASMDADHDGRQDLVLCSIFIPQLVEGATGNVLTPLKQAHEMFSIDQMSSVYFSPIVADVDGDGRRDIYWFNGRYHVLTDDNLNKKWDFINHSASGAVNLDSLGRMRAPDGPMDIVFIGTVDPPRFSGNVVFNDVRNERLICADGADGSQRWTWRPDNDEHFNSIPTLVDLDGDRLHEAVVLVGGELYAVKAPREENGEAQVLWEYPLPDYQSAPANIMAVDADGDGNPELLVAGMLGSNGMLYLIDGGETP